MLAQHHATNNPCNVCKCVLCATQTCLFWAATGPLRLHLSLSTCLFPLEQGRGRLMSKLADLMEEHLSELAGAAGEP
jgi:hypothetical protein